MLEGTIYCVRRPLDIATMVQARKNAGSKLPSLKPMFAALIVVFATLVYLEGVILLPLLGDIPANIARFAKAQAISSALKQLNTSVSGAAETKSGTKPRVQYQEAIKNLRHAIHEGFAAVPAPTHSLESEIENALQTRLSTEQRALNRVDDKHPSDAKAILEGNDYQTQKSGLSGKIRSLVGMLRAGAMRMIGSLCAIVIASFGLFFVGYTGTHLSHRITKSSLLITQQMREREKMEETKRSDQEELESQVRAENESLERQMRELQKRLSLAQNNEDEKGLLREGFNSVNDIIMFTDAEPDHPPLILKVNRAFEQMTGYTEREALRRSPDFLQGADTDKVAVDGLRRQLANRSNRRRKDDNVSIRAELLYYRKDGTPFWSEINIGPVLDDRGVQTHWVWIQRDVTERKQAEVKQRESQQHSEWEANHDALTGLPNRKMYEERLAEEIQRSHISGVIIGVLFFDIDRFKHINDTLGHRTGDELLKQVADRLTGCLRADDLVARMGGDEFTIMLPDIENIENAQVVAQKLLDILDTPFIVSGRGSEKHELVITSSIGISLAPQDGVEIDTLLKNADLAMYRAKDEGRDRYRIYVPKMKDHAEERRGMENYLRKALERDEFHLVYQPQVNLESGLVYGVEALIRWENPVLGKISPAKFIPLAEETDLILSIGQWTLETACHQAAIWQRRGRPLRMSVNLSVRQLKQKDITGSIETVLHNCRLAPEWLDLELTEGMLMEGAETKATLHSLHDLGVRLSVDDFGTGYSNLSYLPQLPLHVLKIDRAFVIPLGESKRSNGTVKALIDLAHANELEVIAEGVETEFQRNPLHKMNCDAMQGYLFSPPTSPLRVEELVDMAREKALKSVGLPDDSLLTSVR